MRSRERFAVAALATATVGMSEAAAAPACTSWLRPQEESSNELNAASSKGKTGAIDVPIQFPPTTRIRKGAGYGNTRLRVYSPKRGGMSYTHSCSIPKEETHAKRIRQTYDCARRTPADGHNRTSGECRSEEHTSELQSP